MFLYDTVCVCMYSTALEASHKVKQFSNVLYNMYVCVGRSVGRSVGRCVYDRA